MINALVIRGFSDAELTTNPEVNIIEKLFNVCIYSQIQIKIRIGYM